MKQVGAREEGMALRVPDNWDELENVLFEAYGPLAQNAMFSLECSYLKAALEKTESLWRENLSRVSEVKMVMLSEAPLFGRDERYFYNSVARFSSFFWFNDAAAVLGNSFADERRFASQQEQKLFLHSKLAEAGFVVLDLFPFALNPKDTSITYDDLLKGNGEPYRTLFQRTCEFYFRPKLRKLIEKGAPIFAFRYKRLLENLESNVRSELEAIGVTDKLAAVSIGGTNMSMNRDRLAQIWSGEPEASVDIEVGKLPS